MCAKPVIFYSWLRFCILPPHTNATFSYMAIIRSLFWAAIFLASTFCFTVLFEHGPSDFSKNSQKEMEILRKVFAGDRKGAADAVLKANEKK